MKRDRTKSEAHGRDAKGGAPAKHAGSEAVPPPEPLKPRRGLFVVLFLFFLLWLGVLLTMWFFTVDHRKG
jgi:cell division septal protein FtsQ